MGLFNRITHGQDLKDRIKKIQDYQAFLEEADVIMNENITRLYELRKEALAQVQFLTVYVKQLQNHPSVLEESMNRALSFMSDIEKAVMWEARYKDFETDDTNPNAGVGVATAGALTGGLTATIGPTAAMAFATTFGTASTGAAISSLGGAAATNAALAWIGGGAAAAGGGGMAAGSAVLAALGPIGLGIGVISLLGGGFFIRRANDKKIKKLDSIIEDAQIDQNLSVLEGKKRRLVTLVIKTGETLDRLKSYKFPIIEADYNGFSFPKESMFALVDDAKLLGKLSQETIVLGQ